MNDAPDRPSETTTLEVVVQPATTGIAAKTEPKDVLNIVIADLHTAILVLISAVYYLDNFSLLYLLRFFGQNQSTSAGIRVVLFSSIACIATHIFHDLTKPAAREIWNHGGLLVDLIGETPPARYKLLLLDFLILALQILHLALHYKTLSSTNEASASTAAQDLEAEEAGISRARPSLAIETEDGIEMQSLLQRNSVDSTRDRLAPSQAHTETTVIVLRKKDFKEVFVTSAHHVGAEGADARVQGFWDRFQAIRARRAAQLAEAQSGANAA
ncbi:hypothetical protein LTS08_004918 [Lithohypha guttulata]|uniref:DUF1746 domain-containing protein n=1 Tax=Lithohypha guttulata TaxID=1690604 RepID=A0AAN7YC21_9EURO|nr:hypothetical protein LTR05_002236 [Lithohypha guttulata]KAK5101311.1 hypothetical protein LTS08_004918 [Lithohypha guttulata]